MSVARTDRTPVRVGSTHDVFNLLQAFLNVRFEIRPWLSDLAAEGVSRVDAENGFHFQVLAPGQEFEQAHAIARVVIPRSRMRRPIHKRTDHLLPVETSL